MIPMQVLLFMIKVIIINLMIIYDVVHLVCTLFLLCSGLSYQG